MAEELETRQYVSLIHSGSIAISLFLVRLSMTELFLVFLNVILPVFSIVLLGALSQMLVKSKNLKILVTEIAG
ncbi:MAG: hypothetical protein QM483_12920 [Desulfuromusa sp.]